MRGFTLVEVIVALVILQVAALGVLTTALAATRTLGAAEAAAHRAQIASSLLDSLRADARPGFGTKRAGRGIATWEVDSAGGVVIRVTSPDSTSFVLSTVLMLP